MDIKYLVMYGNVGNQIDIENGLNVLGLFSSVPLMEKSIRSYLDVLLETSEEFGDDGLGLREMSILDLLKLAEKYDEYFVIHNISDLQFDVENVHDKFLGMEAEDFDWEE